MVWEKSDYFEGIGLFIYFYYKKQCSMHGDATLKVQRKLVI